MWKFKCFLVLREPWLVHFCVVVCELFRVFLISCMTAPGHHTKKHPNLVRKFVLALSWLEIPIVCVWQSFTEQIQKFRKTDNPLTFLLNNWGLVFRGIYPYFLVVAVQLAILLKTAVSAENPVCVWRAFSRKKIVSVHCKKSIFHM